MKVKTADGSWRDVSRVLVKLTDGSWQEALKILDPQTPERELYSIYTSHVNDIRDDGTSTYSATTFGPRTQILTVWLFKHGVRVDSNTPGYTVTTNFPVTLNEPSSPYDCWHLTEPVHGSLGNGNTYYVKITFQGNVIQTIPLVYRLSN